MPGTATVHLPHLAAAGAQAVPCADFRPTHHPPPPPPPHTHTGLQTLVFAHCLEFRPLRKAVEELRLLADLTTMAFHGCVGGEACGYEIARLLRRMQKLQALSALSVRGCDPRLVQQLATAPLARLARLELAAQHDLGPQDLLYVVQAQCPPLAHAQQQQQGAQQGAQQGQGGQQGQHGAGGERHLVVRGCRLIDADMLAALPATFGRPHLRVQWSP